MLQHVGGFGPGDVCAGLIGIVPVRSRRSEADRVDAEPPVLIWSAM
ncbi:MAG: hypothetical protein JOZ69_07720 [Myxococcales bacterium]|nr:hypothetical protein [Myxococcales bacterium]